MIGVDNNYTTNETRFDDVVSSSGKKIDKRKNWHERVTSNTPALVDV